MAQRRVCALLAAGARPRFDSGGDGLLLRAGARHVRLSDDGGALTQAGQLWQAEAAQEILVSGFGGRCRGAWATLRPCGCAGGGGE